MNRHLLDIRNATPEGRHALMVLDGAGAACTDTLLRSGRLDDLPEQNARRLHRDGMGLSRPDCELLRSAWTSLRDRRLRKGHA